MPGVASNLVRVFANIVGKSHSLPRRLDPIGSQISRLRTDPLQEYGFLAMSNEGPEPDTGLDIRRIDAAIANLRKQHVWDVISDQEFKAEYQVLQRQRRALEPKPTAASTPNLDRAAELLQNLPALWKHPGVTQDQRRELALGVFDEIRIRDGKLVAVKPQPEYLPLFAYSIWKENQYVGGVRSWWVEQSPPTYVLASGIVVFAIDDLLRQLSNAA